MLNPTIHVLRSSPRIVQQPVHKPFLRRDEKAVRKTVLTPFTTFRFKGRRFVLGFPHPEHKAMVRKHVNLDDPQVIVHEAHPQDVTRELKAMLYRSLYLPDRVGLNSTSALDNPTDGDITSFVPTPFSRMWIDSYCKLQFVKQFPDDFQAVPVFNPMNILREDEEEIDTNRYASLCLNNALGLAIPFHLDTDYPDVMTFRTQLIYGSCETDEDDVSARSTDGRSYIVHGVSREEETEGRRNERV